MANKTSAQNNFKSIRESSLFNRQAVRFQCVLLQGGEQLIQFKLFNELKLTKVHNFNWNTLPATLSHLEDEDNNFCLRGYQACATNRPNLHDNNNLVGTVVHEVTDMVDSDYDYIESFRSFLDIFHSIYNFLRQEINLAHSVCI